VGGEEVREAMRLDIPLPFGALILLDGHFTSSSECLGGSQEAGRPTVEY